MNWYKENKNEWKEIIETISNEIKRNPNMIEKDTIQSLFLFELDKYDFPFVFKGGTSLSKAFNLIDRFSEDIDLSLSKKVSESEKKKSKEIILKTGSNLGLRISNLESIKSRYDYNKYVFKYDSIINGEELEIIVETSFYQPVYPTCKHKISSFVGEFCEENNISLPIKFDALNLFFNVQTLERTLIDKVFAVCDYKLENMWERDSRHLYDIAKVLPQVIIDENFIDMISKVRDDRMKSKNNPSAQLEHNINDILNNIIDTKFYESDYNKLTSKLLYEEFSYNKAINEGIKIILEKKIF